MKQAIAPMYECRDDRAIFAELAHRGSASTTTTTRPEQWLRDLTKDESFQGAHFGAWETESSSGVGRWFSSVSGTAGPRLSRIHLSLSDRRGKCRLR
jgi:hypothetical protein